MGHIVSAKSMRIGWSTVWCDQWYSNKYYYSQILHAIFRIRYYCVFIFSARHYDRKAIFYSHFEVLRHYKNIFVEVYYYDGKFEDEFEDYKQEVYKKFYYLKVNRDPETRSSFKKFSSFKYFNLLPMVIPFNIRIFKHWQLQRLMNLLQRGDIKRLGYNLKNWAKWNRKFVYLNRLNLHFILFISLYINVRKYLSDSSIWKLPNRNITIRRFYFCFMAYHEIEFWRNYMTKPFNYILQMLSKFYKVFVYFFLTNNNCVNAKFLSRFIARKLRQKYPVKELLNPIKKELIYLMQLCSSPKSSYFIVKLKKYYNSKINVDFKKRLYILLLIYSIRLSCNFFKNNYFTQNNYFTLDMLAYSIFINDYLSNIQVLSNSTRLDKHKIIKKRSFKFLTYRLLFHCLFEKNFLLNIGKYLIFPKLKKSNILNNINIYDNLYDFIYDYTYTSEEIINNSYGFLVDNLIVKNIDVYRAANINLNRFLKYSYWNFSYFDFEKKFNINYLKERIKIHTRGNNLIGYKMYLSGRFSRKQRAGHLWFSKGKVPLNTITAFVDYAYYTVFLPNSAVTVKVWLYKSHDLEYKHFLKL